MAKRLFGGPLQPLDRVGGATRQFAAELEKASKLTRGHLMKKARSPGHFHNAALSA
jgi:hypothetical protein